ncbi:MAG: TIR domain-containing protein, partial [Lachnospiraceae bacterium]|nr:TIR domain-containing protein [Lachnospiraceae bacterium]
YSWTPEENKKWVMHLVEKMQGDGIRVVIDYQDLKPGHDKLAFIERAVSDETIDKVLIICNRTYKEKADERKGGVGDESAIISPYVYGNTKQEKFIPIINEFDEN